MVTTAKFPEPLDRNFLFLDQVDHAEICRIVHGHFQRGWYPSRDRQVLSNPDNSKMRSEEHTSELQSHLNLVCRLLLEKKKTKQHVRSPCQCIQTVPRSITAC